MAPAGGAMNRPSARELAPGPRFFLFAILSLLLMYFDQKDGWGDRIRYGLQAAAYPIQVTIGSPGRIWSSSRDLFRTRGSLREENEQLRGRERELALRTMRLDALEAENARLRQLRGAPPALVQRSQVVNVVDADLGRLRQRLVIDAGDSAGLYRAQTLVDTHGLVGQLVRVGPWSSEVMLISDPESAVPVEIVRTGVRSILVGMGASDQLDLSLTTATADVQVGDELVTSGLGGVYPAGIPVGTITESRRDPDALLAYARARPAASLAASRQLLALWFDPANDAAPLDPKLIDTLPEAPVASPVTGAPAAKPESPKPAATAPANAAPAPPAAPRGTPR